MKIFKFEYVYICIGMERLIDQFHAIVREFRLKRHDLLDYHNNKFDRDYVEFNVKVKEIHFFCQFFHHFLFLFLIIKTIWVCLYVSIHIIIYIYMYIDILISTGHSFPILFLLSIFLIPSFS
jgi:hypothetical protein